MEGEEEGIVENTAEDNKEEAADVTENKQPENKPLSSFFTWLGPKWKVLPSQQQLILPKK